MTLLQSYLEFIKELELLKNITRTAWTSAGKKESTAEHSWRLALFTGIISQEFPELDGKKLLMMALVHDLGEIYDGDISAALLPDPDEKYKSEAGSVSRLLSLLGRNADVTVVRQETRRERYSGSCRRSFHIGDNLKEEDIRASFENGMLKLVFPKEEQRKAVEEKKYIAIE